MDAKSLLLRTALRHVISEPNVEAGFERFQTIAPRSVEYQAFCDTVAACVREGLIREPVRLPEGALQCHWHLELTPAGVEAARPIVMDGSQDRPRAGSGRSFTSLSSSQKQDVDGRDKPGHDG
jgi:hypothetical protein